MGVGGGGLRVRVYQFKLKGLAGGGGLGFCYVIIFCKDGSTPYQPPSQRFLSSVSITYPTKIYYFLGLLYRSTMYLD